MCLLFFFKQKTSYELRISDWSSDVCSSDLPVAGMVPAQQRLGGDDRAVGKADLRLIDERELVALDRAAQIDLELRAIGKLVRERLAELFDPAAPMPLRLLHRRVGGDRKSVV